MAVLISIDHALQATAIIGGLSGQALIIRRNRAGFYAWIISNVALITIAIQTSQHGLVGLYLIYTGMCVYGLMQWRAAGETVN